MFIFILLIMVLLDQATKYIVYIYLQPQNTIPVINKFFYLTYAENTSAAFGILKDRVWILTASTSIAILIGAYYVYKNRRMNMNLKIGIALIMAGVIGNLIDRIRLGFIIDFFDFEIWPIFNIADMSAVAGTIVLVYILLFARKKRIV